MLPSLRRLCLVPLAALAVLAACETDSDVDGPVTVDAGSDTSDTSDLCGTTTCGEGYRCDETGFCARPRADAVFVDRDDPRSGASTASTYVADPGSTTPDVAPLACEGSGVGCADGFDCQSDGSCAASCDACGGVCSYQSLTYVTRNHIATDLLYAGTPAGGNHNPCWAQWGAHDTPVGDEHWVHNLEHGGVAFLYRCPEGCSDELDDLASLTSDYATGTWLSTPEPELSRRFAVVAWGFKLETDCFDRAAFDAFYQLHAGHAPEGTPAPPPGQCM